MMRFVMCLSTISLAACASSGATTNDGLRQVGQTETATSAFNAGTNQAGGTSHVLYTTSDLGVETVVRGAVDTAYRAITRGYLSLGVDTKTMDDAAHVVGNKHLVAMHSMLGRPLSTFFNCGIDPTTGVMRADRYRLTISVVSTLGPGPQGATLVTTKAWAQAEDLATSASSVYCSSTGLIERSLVQASGLQAS
jgi:hypothetical protein